MYAFGRKADLNHLRIKSNWQTRSPKTFRTFQNRIFITEDVDRLGREGIWVEAAGQYKESFRPEIYSMFTAESALQ